MARKALAGGTAAVPAFLLYGEPPQALHEDTVHVETIASRSRLYDWTINPHRHRDLHQILVLQSGGIEAQVDEQSMTAHAPCVVIVPPNVVHAFRIETESHGFVTSFASGLARDVTRGDAHLQRFLQEPGFVALSRRTIEATDIGKLATMLLLEFERSAGGREIALRGLLAALIANIYRVGTPASVRYAEGARDRILVANFREAIERHLILRFSIKRYCNELGVSESRLRRACLRITGRGPVALIHLRMLVEAERQLRYTSMPVTEVAYLLGFEDPAYFTRFFRQRSGVSPRAFRARFT